MTKFPKKLFVKLANEDSTDPDDQYWHAEEDCEQLAEEIGGIADVGVYELVSTGKLATKAEFAGDKARAKARK